MVAMDEVLADRLDQILSGYDKFGFNFRGRLEFLIKTLGSVLVAFALYILARSHRGWIP